MSWAAKIRDIADLGILALMTLDDFNSLSDNEQAAFATQGSFIDMRIEYEFKIALYSHPHFYTEVYYDGMANKIVRCRAFASMAPLAAYIRLN